MHLQVQAVCIQKQNKRGNVTQIASSTEVLLLEWVCDGKKAQSNACTQSTLCTSNNTTSHRTTEQSASQITWFLFQVHPVKPNPHKCLLCQEHYVPLCTPPVSWTTLTFSHTSFTQVWLSLDSVMQTPAM